MAFGTRIVTWFDGRWHEGGSGGNPAVMRAADHGTWQGTLVFDGARSFDGVTPDLDLHCARVIRSAETMGLLPPVTAPEIEALVREGTLDVADFTAADEIFLTGNANKVVPVTCLEARELGAGPVAARAWALYRDFARQRRAAA